MGKLMVVVEKYPDLKANQNFMDLQAQLEGTENRISVERMRYNESVKAYSLMIKRIPTKWIAGMFGFSERSYFEAEKGAENAPKVDFSK